MNLVPEALQIEPEMRDWRHHLHAHPETAFEEQATADYVARQLAAIGLEVHTGLAKTGVVGVLRNGSAGRAVGLRADLDALHIEEATGLAYASRHKGRMHACGHDGHTAMLLGAAKVLAQRRAFDGTLYFVFQPAEENEGGGRVMVEEGLFDRFPMESVYGLHNWPRKPLGTFATRVGPLMGAYDIFEIVATGRGGHAAMPYVTRDPMLFAAQLINALQTIVSRNLHPQDAGVVSRDAGARRRHVERDPRAGRPARHGAHVQGRRAGPDRAAHARDRRRLRSDVRHRRHRALRAALPGHREHRRRDRARDPRRAGGRRRRARRDRPVPEMGSEDFAFMLQAKRGCYVWMGTGTGEATVNVHNPRYDFNDASLAIGASYWVALAEQLLPASTLQRAA